MRTGAGRATAADAEAGAGWATASGSTASEARMGKAMDSVCEPMDLMSRSPLVEPLL
jgi:hypothetical protein